MHPQFIKIDNVRIKLKNIKAYNVSDYDDIYVDVYSLKKVTHSFLPDSIKLNFVGQKFAYSVPNGQSVSIVDVYNYIRSHHPCDLQAYAYQFESTIYENGGWRYIIFDNKNTFDEFTQWENSISYEKFSSNIAIKSACDRSLEIITYQNEHYVFHQNNVSFNLNELVDKLDLYLSD